MTENVLSITNLNIAFPSLDKVVHAIRGCSFNIRQGEILGLVGESGSGKSVTSMAALGLLEKSTLISGSILLSGREVVGRTDAELEGIRGSSAAMIFQNPLTALNPFLKVGRQLTDAIVINQHCCKREAKIIALKSFEDVRLPDPEIAFEKYPHQMSGGQLQRVMIAMALSCGPDLLIADEPTTALDVTVQAQIILLLRELAVKKKLSILFITHDLGVIASLCDRVAVMYAGQIIETGDVRQVLKQPMHPYTRNLMQTVPEVGRTDVHLNYIPGQVPDMSVSIKGCAFASRCDNATDICRDQMPAMRRSTDTHFAICHHVEGDLALVEANSEGAA
ncbi:ABC transporter ATP-binding protein [Sneathiella glossodoripedis]|uniref:ABC transporter ATP-binding protein n=1 Tax=Sneathiella glossodoripedis TaxID=418853 RepID=UPI0004726DF6|nr:ABC transporter ATP-binding protein [Sneathiella glossodoripedis]